MDKSIARQPDSQTLSGFSYREAENLRREAIWKNLSQVNLGEAIHAWLAPLSKLTAKNYRSAMAMLSSQGLIFTLDTLQHFSMINHCSVLDGIRSVRGWSSCTKQARAAAYISLTTFLHRRTDGMIKRAIPSKEGANCTFFRVHDKVVSEALTQDEWHRLLKEMKAINQRDATAAALCLQGARRIGEVLSLQIEDVDFAEKRVKVTPSKTKGLEKTIFVSLPPTLTSDLANLVGSRTSGPLFATSSGKTVDYKQFTYTMKRAAVRAGIKRRVHPHALRASAITHYRSLGFQDFQVQRLTGHASTAMLNAYDKSALSDNASRLASLV